MRKLEKMILSLVCGVSLSVAACWDSGTRPGGDRDHDAAADAAGKAREDDPVKEEVEDMVEEEPADHYMYGPPIDTMYGPPMP